MTVPDVKIRSIVEKEIIIHGRGRKVTSRVPVESGGIPRSLKLYFTLSIINEGDEVATHVVIDNPIPPGTVYAIGSATGEKGAVSCSDDDGVSFHSEKKQLSVTRRCTDLRWVVGELAPGSKCDLNFQVIVGTPTFLSNVRTVLSGWVLSPFTRQRGRALNE